MNKVVYDFAKRSFSTSLQDPLLNEEEEEEDGEEETEKPLRVVRKT